MQQRRPDLARLEQPQDPGVEEEPGGAQQHPGGHKGFGQSKEHINIFHASSIGY